MKTRIELDGVKTERLPFAQRDTRPIYAELSSGCGYSSKEKNRFC